MSATDNSLNVLDLSGNALTLTNNSATLLANQGYVPYATHDGSADYLSRADEAALDITNFLTIGAWIYVNTTPVSAVPAIGKWTRSGDHRSYGLFPGTAGNFIFQVTNLGTAADITNVDGAAYSEDTWYFVVGRYDSTGELKIWVNANTATNTTSIPASLYNSTSAFAIGAEGDGSRVFDGRTALAFMTRSVLEDAVIERLYTRTRGLFGV